MSVYTKIGSAIWMWPPFRGLERSSDDEVGRFAKLLYLHLYTAPEGKASVPGIYSSASVNTISESMGTSPDVVRRGIDRLIEDDLIEFDVQRRVIRLVALPDGGESPPNGNAIRGWWRKFQNVPACAVRDAHVPVLYWIMTEWSRATGKQISADHMKAWNETFGMVSVPSPRPRPRKHVQTSLFAASEPFQLPSGSVDEPETLSSSPSDPESNKIRDSETVPEPFGNQRDQDQRSGSGSGSSSSGEGGSGGKPRLMLVPAPPPNEVAELLGDLAVGHGLDKRHAALREGTLDALCRTIADLRSVGVTQAERVACGNWMRETCSLGRVGGDPTTKLSAFAAIPGMMLAALKSVREQERRRAEVLDQLSAMKGATY